MESLIIDPLPDFTDPDFQIRRSRQAARDRDGGELRRRVPLVEFVQQHTDDAGDYINGYGVPNRLMAPGELPRRMRPDGTFPAGPGRPRGSRRADLTGQVFDHLTVVERVRDHVTPGGKSHPRYRCRCDCGGESLVLGNNLTSARTTSCGHLRRSGVAERNPIVIDDMPGATRADRTRAARALYVEMERSRSGSA